MRRYIDEAVADRPDGLVVSLPDAKALAPSIKAAVEAGIPVVTINSGSDEFKALGVLAHVGQPEYQAGRRGRRADGPRRASSARCASTRRAATPGSTSAAAASPTGLARTGGTLAPLPVPLQDPRASRSAGSPRRSRQAPSTASSRSARAARSRRSTPCAPAGSPARVKLATFDLSPDVLAAVRDGKMLFAVDQQPYLQGYLPVILLAEQARHDIFPGEGELIPTGPQFVTKANAAEVIRLSAEGIR